jgi:hypothetical protein
VDLICSNSASQAAEVILHLDLSGDGKRTDYDNKPEAGMKLRDFIFRTAARRLWICPPPRCRSRPAGSTLASVNSANQCNSLPPISARISKRRIPMTGHCWSDRPRGNDAVKKLPAKVSNAVMPAG